MSFYLPMLMLITSVATYQIAAKLAPPHLNPWHLLSFVYATALLIVLGVGSLDRQNTLLQTFKQTNGAVWVLGCAVVGIELGFLLVYRAGWKISLAGIISSVAVTSLMLPVGLLFFREKLSAINLVGMALCVLGLVFVTRR